ncbi:MAG: ABC transporter permease subunit, partial [Actinomycetota bacterium]|nr:ABC transporter permease subunit [Actinomycetota bacterium]
AVPAVRRRWGPAVALGAYLAVTAVVPLGALLLTAVTRGAGLAPVPGNWTLANFSQALSVTAVRALRNSMVLAVATATAAVLLGGLLASLHRRRAGRALGTAAILTFAVPGSALAVAVLLAYGHWLRDTLLLILVAYVAKLWALGHRTIAGAVEGLPPDLSRAARASGAGAVTNLRTVTAPLLRPALAGAWLLVFVTAVHELTMSALLYGPGSETLAVVVLNTLQLGDVTVTSALAVLLTALVLVGSAPLFVLLRPRT